MAVKKRQAANCEYCGNYVYDDDYGYYVCEMDLDEDEMRLFVMGSYQNCPYFQYGDEYQIVKHQM